MEQNIYIEFEKEDEAKAEFYRISQKSDASVNKKLVLLASYSILEGKPVWVISNYGNIMTNFEKDYDAPSFLLWQFLISRNTPDNIQDFLDDISYLSIDGIGGGAIVGLTSVIQVPSYYWVANIAFPKQMSRQDIYNWLSKKFPEIQTLDDFIRFMPRRLRKDVDVNAIIERIKYSEKPIVQVGD